MEQQFTTEAFAGHRSISSFPSLLLMLRTIRTSIVFIFLISLIYLYPFAEMRHTYKLNLLTMMFLTLWKETDVVPVFKKGNSTAVVNYRTISI